MNNTDSRMRSLDLMRGLAIILMVIANYIAGISWIPDWLKHAKDAGFTVIDAIAPLFISAIGFTFVISYKRRAAAEGPNAATLHSVRRFLAMIGIGSVITAGEQIFHNTGIIYAWGVLQAIGAAGLITLIVIRVNGYVRFFAGIALLVAYQLLLDAFWLGTVLSSSHGGLFGSLGWASMLILSTSISEYFLEKGRKISVLVATGFLFVFAGIGLSFIFTMSKNRVSLPYVLLTTGISTLTLAVFEFVAEKSKLALSFLVRWGKNPLLLYVLHYVLLALVVLPEVPWWYDRAPVWLVSLQLVFLIGFLSVVARMLDKKNIIIRI
jgi:predicted acyltransferase